MKRSTKIILSLVFGTAITLFVLNLFFGDTSLVSEFGNQIKPLFLCRRGPSMSYVSPVIRNAERCLAEVKVQGIQYKCSKKGDEAENMNRFLRSLAEQGELKCREFCKDVSPKCGYSFNRPSNCGFKVASHRAEALGERAGCHFGCEGKAFAYCSIYHGGFIQVRDEQIEHEPSNCRCTL